MIPLNSQKINKKLYVKFSLKIDPIGAHIVIIKKIYLFESPPQKYGYLYHILKKWEHIFAFLSNNLFT